MRCKNCGWSNEPNAKKCIKCNAPLCGSMIASDSIVEPSINEENESDIISKTCRESSSVNNIPVSDNNPNLCPNCGYNVAPNMESCPICNTSISRPNLQVSDLNASNNTPNRQGTINPWGHGVNPSGSSFCQLQPIAWENENISYQPQSYSGQQIVLNRSNTDPNNHTITSKQQAILSFENGKWYIEDKSAHKSTFIQVNGKMSLNDGDVVLMGNRMFIFREH